MDISLLILLHGLHGDKSDFESLETALDLEGRYIFAPQSYRLLHSTKGLKLIDDVLLLEFKSYLRATFDNPSAVLGVRVTFLCHR